MTFSEKFQRVTEPKHWLGDMEADHFHYTAGVAGRRFFEALRDRGQILGVRCPRCGITYVPPRIYCERCFSELAVEDFHDVGRRATVRTFTVVRVGRDGRPLAQPQLLAVLSFGLDDAGSSSSSTGLLHRLGEVEPQDVRTGMEVEAQILPASQREGRITDIRYFKPVG